MKKILVPLLLTSFLFGPSLALAKKIKVVVSIPYETQAPRSDAVVRAPSFVVDVEVATATATRGVDVEEETR